MESKWTRKIVVPPVPQASTLVVAEGGDQKKLYWDRSHYDSKSAQIRALHKSATLYVGNLSFTTRTRHIQQHFSYLGDVKGVVMGLDRIKKTPCGFCFVEYYDRRHALAAVAHLSGTKLDGSVIRVELDAGFQAGRQYGRGSSGGQVRHERNDKRKRSRYSSAGSSANDDVSGNTGTAAAASEARNEDVNNGQGGADAGENTEEGYDGPEGGEGGDEEDESMEPSAKRQRL